MADFDILIEKFESILEKNSQIEVDEKEGFADISWSPENIKSIIKFLSKIEEYLSDMDLNEMDLSYEEFDIILALGSLLVRCASYFIDDIQNKKTFLKDNLDHLMKKIEV